MMLEFDNLKDLLVFNIKYYRYLSGMSQEKLAEECGLSPRYITDIERGRHCPTILKIEKIASSLKIDPHVLFKNVKRDKAVIEKMNNFRQYNQK